MIDFDISNHHNVTKKKLTLDIFPEGLHTVSLLLFKLLAPSFLYPYNMVLFMHILKEIKF